MSQLPDNPLPSFRKRNPHLYPPTSEGDQELARDSSKSEAYLHAEIIQDCRRRGWIYLHGSMASETHRTLGEPDFVILADGGRVFFIECKGAEGKLRPAQAAIAFHAARLGHEIHVVRSMLDYVNVILNHSATPTNRRG